MECSAQWSDQQQPQKSDKPTRVTLVQHTFEPYNPKVEHSGVLRGPQVGPKVA